MSTANETGTAPQGETAPKKVYCPTCGSSGDEPCYSRAYNPLAKRHPQRDLAELNAARGHSLRSVGRFVRGHSPIKGGGTFYGTSWRCQCGESGRVNQAMSAGGKQWAIEQHQAHSDASATPAVTA